MQHNFVSPLDLMKEQLESAKGMTEQAILQAQITQEQQRMKVIAAQTVASYKRQMEERYPPECTDECSIEETPKPKRKKKETVDGD